MLLFKNVTLCYVVVFKTGDGDATSGSGSRKPKKNKLRRKWIKRNIYKMSDEFYLELSENPVQFENASSVNNVFFDEANKQVN